MPELVALKKMAENKDDTATILSIGNLVSISHEEFETPMIVQCETTDGAEILSNALSLFYRKHLRSQLVMSY